MESPTNQPATLAAGLQPVLRKPNATAKRRNTGLTPKVRAAIEAQVFEGLSRSEAAKTAAMSEHGLYQALRKPSVLAYWNECLQVLRTGQRARNVHAAIEVRDQKDNQTARIQAVKLLEEMATEQRHSGTARNVQPGVVIMINTSQGSTVMPDDTLIEINPLNSQDDVQSEP